MAHIRDPQGYKCRRVVYWLTDPERAEHDALLARQRVYIRADLISYPVLVEEPQRQQEQS